MSAPGHAVWELSEKDAEGNARGVPRCSRFPQLQRGDRRALVALEGVDDLVVVATQDAVLVSRQKDANGLKRLSEAEDRRAAGDRGSHPGARSLGSYQSVDNGDRHSGQAHHRQAGRRLSLQKHHHRSSTGSWCGTPR